MGTIRLIFVLGLTALAFAGSATPAEACGNTIARFHERQGDHQPSLKQARKSDAVAVEKATDDLNAGRNAEAIVGLYSHFGFDINRWALNARYVSVARHEVVYIVALAMLRSEGAIERYPEHKLSLPKRKVDNVRWAVLAMEGLAFVGYAADRHVAEAWARDPSLKKAAVEKLLILQQHGELNQPQKDLLSHLLRQQGQTTKT